MHTYKRKRKKGKHDKRFFCEGIPYVDVWESPELVVKKLKDAGWGK